MDEPFNKLKPGELERLALLLEELGEAQQAIGKIIRHGYAQFENRMDLEEELGHVLYAVNLMCNNGDLTIDWINYYKKEKAEDIKSYLHHQEYL